MQPVNVSVTTPESTRLDKKDYRWLPGAYALVYAQNGLGQPCSVEQASKLEIVHYTEDDQELQRDYCLVGEGD